MQRYSTSTVSVAKVVLWYVLYELGRGRGRDRRIKTLISLSGRKEKPLLYFAEFARRSNLRC